MAFHAGFVPHVLQAVLDLVEHVLRVEVDGRGRRASLRFAARSGFSELVGVTGHLLQEHHVAAEPVERFRVDAAAVPAERPWCLDLSAAAVLAWFGGDEHYVETLHVPAMMVLW